jgi:hypothetical protein
MAQESRASRGGFVVCIDNEGYRASLVTRRIYESLPDAEAARKGLIRVVDESGEDYLFPTALFEKIDLPSLIKNKLRSTA